MASCNRCNKCDLKSKNRLIATPTMHDFPFNQELNESTILNHQRSTGHLPLWCCHLSNPSLWTWRQDDAAKIRWRCGLFAWCCWVWGQSSYQMGNVYSWKGELQGPVTIFNNWMVCDLLKHTFVPNSIQWHCTSLVLKSRRKSGSGPSSWRILFCSMVFRVSKLLWEGVFKVTVIWKSLNTSVIWRGFGLISSFHRPMNTWIWYLAGDSGHTSKSSFNGSNDLSLGGWSLMSSSIAGSQVSTSICGPTEIVHYISGHP